MYDGTAFHRIVPDFVIQGGDPLGDGTGGPGYFVDEPPPADTEYTRGTVAMAKSQVEPPGRSGSQFFVVVGADAALDSQLHLWHVRRVSAPRRYPRFRLGGLFGAEYVDREALCR